MKRPLLILLLPFLLLGACNNDEQQPVDNHLVVEAYIDNNGYPLVMLSQSISTSEEGLTMKDVPVRWGKVTLSDGETSEILMGKADKTLFPPFVYVSYDIKGKSGQTYRLEAEYKGMKVSAESTILAPPLVDKITFSQAEGSDSLYSGTIHFRSPEPGNCNYVVFTKVKGLDHQFYPGFMGIRQTSDMEPATIALFRGRHRNDAEEYDPNFALNDTVDIVLARVDDASYAFWKQFQDVVYFQNTMFVSSTSNLHGNVRDGFGNFTARGSVNLRAVVK